MTRVAFVVGDYPPEERRRRIDVIKSYEHESLEIGIVDVPISPYTDLTPADITAADAIFVDAFRRAEKSGFDGVVPLGTLDLGVWGGRSAVDIPVVGPNEAMLHIADMLGTRFGAISYGGQDFNIRHVTARYSLGAKVVDVISTGFSLPELAANDTSMKERFLEAARHLIKDKAADVILPMGISQCPVHIDPHWLTNELGVPVVEGIGAPLRVVEALVRLDLVPSRLAFPRVDR